MEKNYTNLSQKEVEKIERNLRAFLANFGEIIRIEKSVYDKQFYVFVNEDESYKFYADNIDTINGWLYGCVQTKVGVVK